MNIQMGMSTTAHGRYTIRLYRKGLGLVKELEFDNIITDAGLDHLGGRPFSSVSSSGIVYWMHLGTGTSEPSAADTALTAPVTNGVKRHGSGVTITQNWNRATFFGEDPPRVRIVRTYTGTYTAGAIVGNLSEVGVGPGTTSTPDSLFSRALILDSLGNPTTVTATADDTVVVVYTLTLDFTGKTSGSITVGGISYDYATDLSGETSHAPGNLYQINQSADTVGQGASCYLTSMSPWADPTTSYSWVAGAGTVAYTAYTNGSHYRDVTCTFGSGRGSPGIQGVRLHMGGNGANAGQAWRIRFSSPIPFTNVQQFRVAVRTSWARA